MGAEKRDPGQKKRRGRRPIKELTEPQRHTLSVIQSLTRLKGYPPTRREVAAELGIVPGSVTARVKQLIRKGFLRRQARKARSLEVIAIPRDDPEQLVPVDIVGDVAAGPPILAVENKVGEILVESRLVGRSQCFALKVKGDSMTGVGIHDGDYCIVRQQLAAESGDIVVAIRGDEGTVKRLHISEKGVELRSENPDYEPIPIGPEDDFHVVGKVLAVRCTRTQGGDNE